MLQLKTAGKVSIYATFRLLFILSFESLNGYTGAVKPPVRRTGNRKSRSEETGIYAAEPPSRRWKPPGWGCRLLNYCHSLSAGSSPYTSLSLNGSWQDRTERCWSCRHRAWCGRGWLWQEDCHHRLLSSFARLSTRLTVFLDTPLLSAMLCWLRPRLARRRISRYLVIWATSLELFTPWWRIS